VDRRWRYRVAGPGHSRRRPLVDLVDLLQFASFPPQVPSIIFRENQFVPLANVVLSAELERSLLGAEVNRMVENSGTVHLPVVLQGWQALKVWPWVIICPVRSKTPILHSPSREVLFAKPSCGYFVCWERYADNRYSCAAY
jgi:hypothetical protein